MNVEYIEKLLESMISNNKIDPEIKKIDPNFLKNNLVFGDEDITNLVIKLIKSKNKNEELSIFEGLKKIFEENFCNFSETSDDSSKPEEPKEEVVEESKENDTELDNELKGLFSTLLQVFEGKINYSQFKEYLSKEVKNLRNVPFSQFKSVGNIIEKQFSKEVFNSIKNYIWNPSNSDVSSLEIFSLVKDENHYPYKTNVKTDIVKDMLNSLFSSDKNEEIILNCSNFFSNKSISDLITIDNDIFKIEKNFSIEDLVEATSKGKEELIKLITPIDKEVKLEDLTTGDVAVKSDGCVFSVIENNPNNKTIKVKVFSSVVDYFQNKVDSEVELTYKPKTKSKYRFFSKSNIKRVSLKDLKVGEKFFIDYKLPFKTINMSSDGSEDYKDLKEAMDEFGISYDIKDTDDEILILIKDESKFEDVINMIDKKFKRKYKDKDIFIIFEK